MRARSGLAGGGGLGEQIEQRWKGSVDQVVILDIPGSSPAQQARMTGMLEGLRNKAPVPAAAVSHLHIDRKRVTAETLMSEVLSRQSCARRIAVLCYNDLTALAALAAVENSGFRDSVAIVGQGAVAEVRRQIRRPGSPLWGAVAHFPERFGAKLVPLLKRILRGEQAPQTTYMEHLWLTRSNLHSYDHERP